MRRGKCKSCRATIVWVLMDSGSEMPLDPLPVASGNVYRSSGLDEPEVYRVVSKAQPAPTSSLLYMSHFATCPNARAHRKAKTSPATRRVRSEG